MDPGDDDERQGWPFAGGGDGEGGGGERGPPPPPATGGGARVAPAPAPPPRSSSSSRALAALQRAPSSCAPEDDEGGGPRAVSPPFKECSATRGSRGGSSSSSSGRSSSGNSRGARFGRPPRRSLPPPAAPAAKNLLPQPPKNPGRPWPRWRARLLGALDDPRTTSLLLLLTLFAILQEDCKHALLPPGVDVYVEAATAAAVAALLAEIALSSLVRPRFFLSFYFWLDTLATLSLGFEIPALRAALKIGPSGGSGLGDAWAAAAGAYGDAGAAASSSLPPPQPQQPQPLQGFVDVGAAAPAAGLRAAGEQALVWAKAGRAVKVLRLVRALQQQRAWRQQRAARRGAAAVAAAAGADSAKNTPDDRADDQEEEEWYADVVERYRYAEARVGHRLQELTVRRLAVGLLATVAALALLDAAGRGGPAFGAPAPAPGYAGLRMLHAQVAEAAGAALEREFDAGGGVWGVETGAATAAAAAAAATAATARAVAAVAAADATSAPGFRAALAALSQTVEYNIGGRRGAFRPLLLVVANVTLVPWEERGGGGAAAAAAAAGASGSGDRGNGGSTSTSSSTSRRRRRRYLEVEGAVLRTQVCPSSLLPLLPEETTTTTSSSPYCAMLVSAAMLDARAALAARSAAGVARTLLLAALLAAGSHLVQRDTRELVLAPVERMVARVRAMSDDPLGAFAAKWGDGGGGGLVAAADAAADASPPPTPPRPPRRLLPLLLLVRRLLRLPPPPSSSSSRQQRAEDPPGQYETRLLEDAIQRVCALLAVSFGEAGAAIVADNLRRGSGGGGGGGGGGGFDPMVPGRRVVAVFGFCDIRRFTDATEVLGEGVMEFVNAVAALAHGAAAARGGAPNKNVGDAFLLVWRLPRGLKPGDAAVTVAAGVIAGEEEEAAEGEAGMAAAAYGGGGEEDPRSSSAAAAAAAVGRELQGVAAALAAQRVASRALYAARPSSASPTSAGGAGSSSSLAAAPGAAAAAAAFSRFSRSPSPSLLLAAAPPPPPSSSSRPPLRRSLLATAAATVAAAATAHANTAAAAPSPSPPPPPPPTRLLPPAALEAARRSVLACQDVRRLPLSPPAKAALVRSVADGALAAFCLTRVAMAASARLRRYGERGDLCTRMADCSGSSSGGGSHGAAAASAPPPPYRVQMGFGLHVGWAIEGAIGSKHKVDASYLSPHVNLASRLEAATKQFRVPLLASRAFWSCLSPAVRRRARLLDRIVVKGSAMPLEVYTYDLDVGAALEACAGGGGRKGAAKTTGEGDDDNDEDGSGGDRAALALLERRPGDEWGEHPALARSWRITEAWKARFDAGVSAYLAGDWPAARASLEPCRVLPQRRGSGVVQGEEETEEQDGPTAVLLEVMGAHGFVAPAGWRGFRELTEK